MFFLAYISLETLINPINIVNLNLVHITSYKRIPSQVDILHTYGLCNL